MARVWRIPPLLPPVSFLRAGGGCRAVGSTRRLELRDVQEWCALAVCTAAVQLLSKSKSWQAFAREDTLADKQRALDIGGFCAMEAKWEEPDGLWHGQAVALRQVAGVPTDTVPEKLGCTVTGNPVNKLNI